MIPNGLPIAMTQSPTRRVAIAKISYRELWPAWNDLEQSDVGGFIVAFYRGGKLTAIAEVTSPYRPASARPLVQGRVVRNRVGVLYSK